MKAAWRLVRREFVLLVVSLAAGAVAFAQGPRGRRGRGRFGPGRGPRGPGRGPHGHGPRHQGGPPHGRGHGPDPQFFADRRDFHFLLANHRKIRRRVKMLPNGVETWTESADPQVVQRIQRHVRAMHRRIKNQQPVRWHDPLFAEIFRHAQKIHMKIENTPHGVHVIETSEDPYVVKLIQAHARVVSGFVRRGFAQAHRHHQVPKP